MLVAYKFVGRDIIKLREPPKDLVTKFNSLNGRGNVPGYGKNTKYATMDNPQPSPCYYRWDAVHRLNGDGSEYFWLKI